MGSDQTALMEWTRTLAHCLSWRTASRGCRWTGHGLPQAARPNGKRQHAVHAKAWKDLPKKVLVFWGDFPDGAAQTIPSPIKKGDGAVQDACSSRCLFKRMDRIAFRALCRALEAEHQDARKLHSWLPTPSDPSHSFTKRVGKALSSQKCTKTGELLWNTVLRTIIEVFNNQWRKNWQELSILFSKVSMLVCSRKTFYNQRSLYQTPQKSHWSLWCYWTWI